jgi:CCR4-NOT transcription complex subunit 4
MNTTKTPSQASSSRPPTPASHLAAVTPADVKTLRQKDPLGPPTPPPCRSPTSSVAVESDLGSDHQDGAPAARRRSSNSTKSSAVSIPSAPPGLPAVPPGLSAPSGIPLSRVGTDSPQTPILASQTSYQMSTAAKALLDDVKARRDFVSTISPFPDLDRTLQTLKGAKFGGFSFNLDPKLAGDNSENAELLPEFDLEANTPFQGSYLDTFPGSGPSTQLPAVHTLQRTYPHLTNRSLYDPMTAKPAPITIAENQVIGGSNYTGSFNPFADNADESPSPSLRGTQYSPLDDDLGRKVSRFGFARGRRSSTAASSPLHASSPLANADNQTSFYSSGEYSQTAQPQWVTPSRQQYSEYGYLLPNSPLVPHTADVPSPYPQHGRFQPFDGGVSEAQLRELFQSSRDREVSIMSGPPGMNSLYV